MFAYDYGVLIRIPFLIRAAVSSTLLGRTTMAMGPLISLKSALQQVQCLQIAFRRLRTLSVYRPGSYSS